MRYLKIEEAQPGMVLAKGVYDSHNRLLLAQHQELTEEYIRKLTIWGYPGFYIYDDFSDGIQVNETISIELRNRGVEALRKQNIDQTLDVAKDIVDSILSNGTTALDMVDLRTFDDYTYRHSVNVAVISTVLGMGMHLKRSMLEELCIAAIFHDLGKLMIAPLILNKPARLTSEEFEEIKKHSELSVRLLQNRKQISDASKLAILHHHENEDGTGYPTGLSGEDVPLYSKIIHVADVYDALTSKRPYKEPYAPSEALEYLMGGSNILFDESIVRVFMGCVPVYPKGSTITLSDQRLAVVFENNANPLRPKVRVESGEVIDLGDEKANLSLTVNPSSVVQMDYSSDMSALKEEVKDERKRILIVNSDVDELSTIKSALEKSYHVRIVKSGEEALKYLREHGVVDLVMIDVDLNEKMNGIDTVKQIRDIYGDDLKVMFLSGRADRSTVQECKSIHAIDYILKPFQPVYVLTRAKIALEGIDEDLS